MMHKSNNLPFMFLEVHIHHFYILHVVSLESNCSYNDPILCFVDIPLTKGSSSFHWSLFSIMDSVPSLEILGNSFLSLHGWPFLPALLLFPSFPFSQFEHQKGSLYGMDPHSTMVSLLSRLKRLLVPMQSSVKMGLDLWWWNLTPQSVYMIAAAPRRSNQLRCLTWLQPPCLLGGLIFRPFKNPQHHRKRM